MADQSGQRARRSARRRVSPGAEVRLEPSPYGDQELRARWAETADQLTTLDEAVAALASWRERHRGFDGQDSLWVEARLEERVAVLRFESMTDTEIRTRTLTGEDVEVVCAEFLARAELVGADHLEIERVNEEFRHRYKPPIMPTNDFMRTETMLAELLMRRRSLNWFDRPLSELRAQRGVVVHAAPPEPDGRRARRTGGGR